MNKVFLIGRLTKEADLQFIANTGTALCKLSLAVDRQGKDKGTDFINCIAFGKTGEAAATYTKKGSLVAVSGSIQTSNYKDKENKTIYKTEILISEIKFLDVKKQDNNEIQFPISLS